MDFAKGVHLMQLRVNFVSNFGSLKNLNCLGHWAILVFLLLYTVSEQKREFHFEHHRIGEPGTFLNFWDSGVTHENSRLSLTKIFSMVDFSQIRSLFVGSCK